MPRPLYQMRTDEDLETLLEHVRQCPRCQEVLTQMHPRCTSAPALSNDEGMPTPDHLQRVRDASRLLQEAIQILRGGHDTGQTDLEILAWIIARTRIAARHLIAFGVLTDSDIELGGLHKRPRRLPD